VVVVRGLVVALLVVGCGARRAPFVYDLPAPRVGPAGLVAGYQPVLDRRTDRSIDGAFDGSAVGSLGQAIGAEIAAAGVFERIIPMPEGALTADDLRARRIDVLFTPSLEEMSWDVPNYEAIRNRALAITAMTAGIGGLVYASTPTEVNGRTVLVLYVTDVTGSGQRLERRYLGRASDRRTKLICDSPATRRDVVERSVRAAMQRLAADVPTLARRPPAPAP
jgi:hypothetical protein